MAEGATARRRGKGPDSSAPSIDAQPIPVKPSLIVSPPSGNAVSGDDVPSRKTSAELISSVDALTAFEDGMSFMTFAARSLAQDEFSKCFEPRERPAYHPVSLMYLLWLVGSVLRYGCLFPFRLSFLFFSHVFLVPLLLTAHAMGFVALKRSLFLLSSRIWLVSFSAYVRYHGDKPRLAVPHIFVANHTSFTDYFLVSACGFPNATVAQVHGGLFGLLQRYLLSLNGSLSFHRNEQRDRVAVVRKMKEHVFRRSEQSSSAASFDPPILVFPEGTCVNNEYTVLFHKGAFELDCVVCPVAIKYNKTWLDPYWNTREQSFTQHIAYLMTRWLVVVDVWWLEPQVRQTTPAVESPVSFADRVKAQISRQADLKNLSWDGYLKNVVRSNDLQKLRQRTQSRYVSYLRHRTFASRSSDDLSSDSSLTHRHSASDPQIAASMLAGSRPTSPDGATAAGAAASTMMFPPWLPESSIIEIQNELLIDTSSRQHHHHNGARHCNPAVPNEDDASRSTLGLLVNESTAMLRSLLSRAHSPTSLMHVWRKFTDRLRRTSRRFSPSLANEAAVVAEHPGISADELKQRRVENSVWRMTRIAK